MVTKTDALFQTSRRQTWVPYFLLALTVTLLGMFTAIATISNKQLSGYFLYVTVTAAGFALFALILGILSDDQQKQLRKAYDLYIIKLGQYDAKETFRKVLYDGTNIVATYQIGDDAQAKIATTLADNGIHVVCSAAASLAAQRASQMTFRSVSSKHFHIELSD